MYYLPKFSRTYTLLSYLRLGDVTKHSHACEWDGLERFLRSVSFIDMCTASEVNPLGPRILLKHATMFPGFLANFERFYLLVLKNL